MNLAWLAAIVLRSARDQATPSVTRAAKNPEKFQVSRRAARPDNPVMFQATDEVGDWPEGGVDKLCLLETAERLFGADVAEMIRDELGGTVAYINAQFFKGSRLAELLGEDCAAALGKELGGLSLSVPLGAVKRRRERIRVLTEEGATVSKIARELSCTERTVNLHRAQLRREGEILPRSTAREVIDQARERIRTRIAGGATVAQVAHELGYSARTVQRHLAGVHQDGDSALTESAEPFAHSPQNHPDEGLLNDR